MGQHGSRPGGDNSGPANVASFKRGTGGLHARNPSARLGALISKSKSGQQPHLPAYQPIMRCGDAAVFFSHKLYQDTLDDAEDDGGKQEGAQCLATAGYYVAPTLSQFSAADAEGARSRLGGGPVVFMVKGGRVVSQHPDRLFFARRKVDQIDGAAKTKRSSVADSSSDARTSVVDGDSRSPRSRLGSSAASAPGAPALLPRSGVKRVAMAGDAQAAGPQGDDSDQHSDDEQPQAADGDDDDNDRPTSPSDKRGSVSEVQPVRGRKQSARGPDDDTDHDSDDGDQSNKPATGTDAVSKLRSAAMLTPPIKPKGALRSSMSATRINRLAVGAFSSMLTHGSPGHLTRRSAAAAGGGGAGSDDAAQRAVKCCICDRVPTLPYQSPCQHVCCHKCWLGYFKEQKQHKCPECLAAVLPEQLHKLSLCCICNRAPPPSQAWKAPCSHTCCLTCWSGYLEENASCPECSAKVDRAAFATVAAKAR